MLAFLLGLSASATVEAHVRFSLSYTLHSAHTESLKNVDSIWCLRRPILRRSVKRRVSRSLTRKCKSAFLMRSSIYQNICCRIEYQITVSTFLSCEQSADSQETVSEQSGNSHGKPIMVLHSFSLHGTVSFYFASRFSSTKQHTWVSSQQTQAITSQTSNRIILFASQDQHKLILRRVGISLFKELPQPNVPCHGDSWSPNRLVCVNVF